MPIMNMLISNAFLEAKLDSLLILHTVQLQEDCYILSC